MIDKLPPHAPECEQAVIGSLLTEPVECIPQAMELIQKASFYDLRHQILWESIIGLSPAQVNVISIRQSLKDSGDLEKIGGDAYLAECQDRVTSTANLSQWLVELSEKHSRRRLIAACTELIGEAYSARETASLLDMAEIEVLKIRPASKSASDIKELLRQAIDKIEQRFNSNGGLTGLPTGLVDLDKMSDGVHNSEMVVIAGFPSTGKTAIAVNIAVHNALRGVPVAIFSAEMRPVQLVVRSLCSESRVNFYRLNSESFPRLVASASQMSKAPLYIEQASKFSVAQISAISRRLKQKHNIQMVVIDYIQLLTGTGDNREQEISSISKGIKAIAMELDVPVLALSQLNDDGKLRESRAIGQDADTVWKLENDGERQPLIQPIKLQVEKCRDGATGKVELTFMKEWTRFECRSKVQDEESV